MFPLRRRYVMKLLKEAGFEKIHTYGDFQSDFEESEPDFFIHIAEKRDED